jgi:ferredoxin
MRGRSPEVVDLSDDEVIDVPLPELPPEMGSAVTDAMVACPKQALRMFADQVGARKLP